MGDWQHRAGRRPISPSLEGEGIFGAWQHFAVSTLSLLVVVSLALSWMGPMLDHHFAERHPGHQHIYLSGANPEHSHDFQPFHSHSGPGSLLLAAEDTPANTPDGILFVVPASGSAHSVADITMPASGQSIGFGVAGGTGLLGHHLRRETAPPGASIAPPTLPPRA